VGLGSWRWILSRFRVGLGRSVGQCGQRGDLFGQARLLRTLNSLTGASPSTLHQCRLLLCLSSRPPGPAEHASYSTVFLSIDKHRRTKTQRQREEDGEYKKDGDNELSRSSFA